MLIVCSLTASGIGRPLQELAAAVARSGAPSVEGASPKQFLGAYAAVLVRAKPKEVICYVNAAVKLRPDLAPKIVVITLNVRRPNMKVAHQREVFQEIADIIQAAVVASPDTAAAIVKAAVEAVPFARDGIVTAAIAAAPDQKIALVQAAYATLSAGADGMGLNGSYVFIPAVGTINPADYTRPETVNSPEQPPTLP
jgi:hypothetical protein